MSERTEKPAFIGVDWGTSSFRAWLFAPSGTVLEDVQGPWGISQIKMTPFRQILLEAVGNWLGQYPVLPIIMCGMIGSAQGWHEAGYLTGTVGVGELAAGAVKVADPELEMYIIPGIKGRSADDYNDVMRGEETLLAGRLGRGQEDKAIFCLPGTHSKWISVEKGRIERLTTFMTGELFHLMKAQSILAPLIDSDSDVRLTSPIFADGLALAASPSGLLHQLFSIRAGVLTERFARGDVLTLLSAVLVGNECKHVDIAGKPAAGLPVTLMTSGQLGDVYQQAFQLLNIDYQVMDATTAAQAGLYAIFLQLPDA